jgi:ATP-dependent DNA helicase RecQ
LTPSAAAVLRGEVELLLRVPSEAARRAKGRTRGAGREAAKAPIALDTAALDRYAALRAWRGEVARARNLPAYVVFHDATLAEMARLAPRSLDELASIGGVGEKKLEAYGDEILRVLDPGRAGVAESVP